MKKNIIRLLLVICLLCSVALTVTACKGVKMTISFVVDDEIYATIDTSGNEIVTIPQSPTKDGYTFDGWYWDDGTWQRPFTANSLLNEPLTANMPVYAKFTEIHNHVLTLQPAVKANCEHAGNEAYYTCTCGKLFADAQATVELTDVPTIDKTEHTPTDWIADSKATCTENGSKHTECSVCGTTLKTELIPSNGHTPETQWIIDKTATCTENGSKHLECSVCHATLQIAAISAVGHSYSTEWSKDERGHWHVATCEHTLETTAIVPHMYDSNYKCKICDYQDTSLHGTEIATDVFTVNGETLYAKTPNSQTTFSFINAIQVADGATFLVATDLAAENVIRTKTVSLNEGDNTYYVLVENGNDIQLYTVTLHRIPIYTLTFVTNGGTACESQRMEENNLATEPTTSRIGYTFVGWDYDFTMPVTQNTTVTASWTANDYIITYDVNGGVLTDTQYTATYDSMYALAVPTREGHTFQGWYIGDTQIADVNGKSIADWTYTENKAVTAKWKIKSYSLVLKKYVDNAIVVFWEGTKQYNDEVTLSATRASLGYQLGWYDGYELFTRELSYTFNMPARDLTLTSRYEVLPEMSNFIFESTSIICNITGVLDATITEVVVPNYVTSIESKAFCSCVSLVSVTIPESVTSIGADVFWGCGNLESMTLPFVGSSANATSASRSTLFGYIFGTNSYEGGQGTRQNYYNANWTQYDTVYYIPSKLANVTITGGEILESAFHNCSNIKNITIGDNVTLIDRDIFLNCTNLNSVTISNNVSHIFYEIFSGCSNLERITLPFRSENPFGYLFGSTSYDGGVQTYQMRYNYDKTSLESVEYYIPATLSDVIITDGDILNRTFSHCSKLKHIEICHGVKSIGEYTFSGCKNLVSIVIPDSVTSIGNSAFYECNNLTSINYSGTIDSWCRIDGLNNLMESGASSKTLNISGKEITGELVIPDTVTAIPYYAFRCCSSITNILFPNNVMSIGNYAFADCDGLTSVTIPDSVISIGSYSFYGCNSLKNVTIGKGVGTIGGYAFYGCASLTDIAIPDSVTTISDYSFYECSNLTSVTIGNNVKSIGDLAFWYCSNLTSVIIPDSVTSIGKSAFQGCSNLTKVIIGNGVTLIGEYAFRGCSSLKTVYYAGTADDWKKISIGDYNTTCLTNAARYYYSETEPALNSDGTAYDGNYWRYNENGEIEIWEK